MLGNIIDHFTGNIILSITNILFAKIILREKIKISKVKFIILILIMASFHTTAVLYLNGTIKTILTLLIISLTYKYVFKIDIKKSIFLTAMYFIIILIPDIITVLLFTSLFKINKIYYYNNLASGFISTLSVCLILLIITCFFRRLLSKLLNIKLENKTRIVIFSVLTLVSVGILFFEIINKYKFDNNILLYLILILVFIFILFNLIKEKVNNDDLILKYDRLLDFMKTYEKGLEEQRILRHENKNNLISIKAKIIDNEENNEIISYINELIDDYHQIDKEHYAKFAYLPSNGLKGLFYYKADEAENKGIDVKINISKDIEKTNLSKISSKEFKNLGNILGVYLDNAIEASLESEDKKLGIEIYQLRGNIYFIISNSYSNKIDTRKIGNVSFTTKGKNHGHGLLLAKRIINNSNDMFKDNREITDKLFIQKLSVKLKK